MKNTTIVISFIIIIALVFGVFYLLNTKKVEPISYEECIQQAQQALSETKKYKPASEEPIGARRVDDDGNVWIKRREEAWETNAKSFKGVEWGDVLIDRQKGGAEYPLVANFSHCEKYALPSDTPITQNYQLKDRYFVYDNIPFGLKFTNPREPIPDDAPVVKWNETDAYFVRIASDAKTLDEPLWLDENIDKKRRCKNTGKNPIVVNYFKEYCDPLDRRDGSCAHYSRIAFLCGDIYFIEQFSMSSGPIMYGPFERI